MEKEPGKVEMFISAIEENVDGLFGGAMLEDQSTLWLRGRMVFQRFADRSNSGWRLMTEKDVRDLRVAEAIDDETMHRQLVRVLY